MLHGSLRRRLLAGLRHGIVYRTEGGEGGTGAGGGGGGAATERPEKPVGEVVRSLIGRHGSAETALGVLAGENRDYRKRHRKDEATIAELRGKLPKEGGVVLTPEQAKDWTAYQALGKPDDISKTVAKVTELETQVAEGNRRELLRTAGAAVGYKSTVLEDRVKADNLHVEMREVEVEDGKGGKVKKSLPHVRKADKADAPLELMTAYAESNWGDYLPSLKAEAAPGNRSSTGGTSSGGIKLPASAPASKEGAGKGGPLAEAMSRAKGRATVRNPLMPEPAKAAE